MEFEIVLRVNLPKWRNTDTIFGNIDIPGCLPSPDKPDKSDI